MPDLCANFMQNVPLLLEVNSGRCLFDVLTIKLSLHKLITELNTNVWALANIQTFEIENV